MNKKLSLLILLIIMINSLNANTRRYRLMFNDDPSTMVTIAWDQYSGSTPVVHFGTTDFGTAYASYPNSASPSSSTTTMGMSNQFVTLSGLTPNTAYYFVIHDSQGTSSRYWFKTCPNVNTEQLSFISGGDSRSGQTQRINSNRMVAKIRPHAVLFGGDLVDVPGNSEYQMWMDDWQYSITTDGQIIPIVHSYGNHEAGGTGGPYLLRDLFDVTDDAYYKVTFGGNLFSVYTLNGELLPGHTIPNATKRTAMKNWLASTLAADNAIWKSAQYHRPIVPHEAGKGEGTDEHNDWAQNFYDYGVRLVMESDAHVVKITDEVRPVNPVASGNSSTWFTSSGIAANKGITFIGEGSWGTLRNPDDLHPMTLAAGEFYQFSWIIVNTCSIQVRTIDTQNPNSVTEHTAGDYFSISPALEALVWKPTALPTGIVEIINCSAPIANFSGSPTNVFTGQTVNFTDLSTNTPTSWSWNFGGGGTPNTSTSQNPSIVFNTVGTYTVTLTATNADGSDAETKTAYINVTTPVAPVANFSADDVTPTVSQNVTFTDLSTGNPTSWAWNFGDGNNSTLQNPVHAYTAGGTYTVTLTATNGVGNDAEVKTNYITVSTGGSISVAISNGSDDVEEYNTDGTLYTNSSDLEFCYDGSAGNQHVGLRFQGVNIPQGATITNAYIQMRADETDNTNLDVFIAGHDADNSAAWSGTYAVSGRTKTSATTTWVHNGTTAWTADVTIAQTPSLSTMVEEIVNRPGWLSGNAMSFIFWDNNSDQDERVADPIEGGYAPILFVDYTMPSIPSAPVANFSSSTNTICAGSNVNFTDVSTNTPTSWSWNFGDGNTSTLQNPTNTYLFSGTYTVTLTATNAGGSNFVTQSNLITVVALPNVTASSSISICTGSSTTISAAGATTYSWDNGLGAGASHLTSPITTTTYSVTGTQNGCSNSDIVTIAVDSPNIPGTASPISVCESNTSVNLFTAITGEDAGGIWNDDETTGALSGNTVNATLLVTGNIYDFTYTVPANGACAAMPVTTQITVTGTVNAGTPTANNSGCVGESNIDLFNSISGFTSGGTWNDDEATGFLSGNILNATSLTAGVYDFTYSVGGGACGTDAQTVSITINSLPNVNASTNTSICEGGSTTISATGATSFSWDNGLGTGTSHIISPSTTTTYIVTGTMNGCTNTDNVTITVDTQNNPGNANAITVCSADASVDLFLALNGEDVNGTWNDDESTGALSGNTINATLLTTGNTYDFTYTVPANGSCPIAQTTTQVTITGTVDAGTPTANNSGCTNDNAFDLFNTISGFTSGGTWNDDDATGLLSGNILDASSLAAGIYVFTYSVGGSACGTDAQTISVTINNVPTVDAGLGTAICEGESVNLSATGATSFNWDNGLGNGNTHSVTPVITTTYTVTGTTNGCSAQDNITITVNTLPNVTMDPFTMSSLCEQENPIVLPNGNPSGGTYSGNGVSGTNFDPAVAGIGTHTIIYSFTDGSNCTNTAQQNIEVTNCLNVFEGVNLVFKIYPNPANDFILIERSDASDYSHVVIIDITGKVVYDKVVYENPLEIKVNQWSNGVYTVKFVNRENKIITQKIIIQK